MLGIVEVRKGRLLLKVGSVWASLAAALDALILEHLRCRHEIVGVNALLVEVVLFVAFHDCHAFRLRNLAHCLLFHVGSIGQLGQLNLISAP